MGGDAAARTAAVVSPATRTSSASAETRRERVAPAEPDELGVGRVDPRQRFVRAAVGDELRRAAKQLDELRRELGASGAPGDAPARRASEPARTGHEDAADEQPDREDAPAAREDRAVDGDARRRRRRAPTSGGPSAADVEVLQRVDVADHPPEQLAAAVALELCRRERLDALVEVARGRGRAPAARRRATRAARGSAPAAGRGRRSGRRRSSIVSERIGGCSAAREIR